MTKMFVMRAGVTFRDLRGTPGPGAELPGAGLRVIYRDPEHGGSVVCVLEV